ERVVAAEHDLADADLRDEMAQRLRGEDQGIEIELTQVLRRLPLQLDFRITCARRRDETGVVGARRIGAKISAAMRRQNFQTREAVERAIEDQVRKRDGGVERVADGVRQPAIALKALGKLRRALRVNEQHSPKLFGLRPYGVKPRIRKVLARDAAADLGAPQ